jgi:hypothetical protein
LRNNSTALANQFHAIWHVAKSSVSSTPPLTGATVHYYIATTPSNRAGKISRYLGVFGIGELMRLFVNITSQNGKPPARIARVISSIMDTGPAPAS